VQDFKHYPVISQLKLMSTKPAEKTQVAKPPVDNSIGYIWTILILTGIAVCTRVNFAWVGNDRQAVSIEITSRIGEENTGSSNFKNVIHLTLGNPFTTANLDRLKEFGASDKEIKGEFLDREFSVAPKNKAHSTPKQTSDNSIAPERK
jgi:hypothetical protein